MPVTNAQKINKQLDLETKLSRRQIANRENGRKGGLKTAATHGKDFCIERARKGGEAVRNRYGNQLYIYYNEHLRKYKRKNKDNGSANG